MIFSYDKFLKPLTSTSKNIQILIDDNEVKYIIDPFDILNTMISNNLLKINLKSGKCVVLNFSTTIESKDALKKLQEQVDILRNK